MRAERFELPLRIVVDDPVPGLALALQRGAAAKAELVHVAEGAGEPLPFDLEVNVEGALGDGGPRLLGPYIQGPPEARFIYLAVGRLAGQAASPWAGRIKVPLRGLTWDMIDGLPPRQRLEA